MLILKLCILFFNMSAMNKVFMFLFFIFSLCIFQVASHDKCAYTRCRREDPGAQFPFILEGHQDRSCGYPGFNLSCNDETNGTILDLGTSGKFSVRAINYVTQEVLVYDQDNCLPKRLMNLDLTDTPFKGYNYQNFNFYNCSSNFSLSFLEPISCLSTPNHSVYAAPLYGSRGRSFFDTCTMFGTASVPLSEIYDRVGYLTDLNTDLHLPWQAPNCGECILRGGTCRFKNRNKNEIGCYNLPRRGLSKVAKYVLAVGLGVPALVFVLLIVGYVYGRLKSNNGNRGFRISELSSSVLPQPPIYIVGLDESVIQSYPKVVLGESRRLVKPEDNICPICLSEYKAKETLKTIPDCKHCFHAACIDQWLRRNITCPLCRNAPMTIPMPEPAPAPVSVSVPPSQPESHPV